MLELETDKAVVEVPSTVSGTVREVKAQVGQKLRVGDLILTIAVTTAPGLRAENAPTGAPRQKAQRRKRAPADNPPTMATWQ